MCIFLRILEFYNTRIYIFKNLRTLEYKMKSDSHEFVKYSQSKRPSSNLRCPQGKFEERNIKFLNSIKHNQKITSSSDNTFEFNNATTKIRAPRVTLEL